VSSAASDTTTPMLITGATVGGVGLLWVACRPFVVHLNEWEGSDPRDGAILRRVTPRAA
jgi:hypothetical protein